MTTRTEAETGTSSPSKDGDYARSIEKAMTLRKDYHSAWNGLRRQLRRASEDLSASVGTEISLAVETPKGTNFAWCCEASSFATPSPKHHQIVIRWKGKTRLIVCHLHTRLTGFPFHFYHPTGFPGWQIGNMCHSHSEAIGNEQFSGILRTALSTFQVGMVLEIIRRAHRRKTGS
jgi:hypothetical protein